MLYPPHGDISDAWLLHARLLSNRLPLDNSPDTERLGRQRLKARTFHVPTGGSGSACRDDLIESRNVRGDLAPRASSEDRATRALVHLM